MSIRLRLSIWYGVIFAIATSVLSVGLYLFMIWHLDRMVEDSILNRAEHLASAMTVANAQSEEASPQIVPLEAFENPGVLVQVWSASGELLAKSSNLVDRQLSFQPTEGLLSEEEIDGSQVRKISLPVSLDGRSFAVVQVGVSLDQRNEVLRRLRWLLGGGALVAIAVVFAASWLAARRVLLPVAEMTDSARAIALSGGFSRRITRRADSDELGRLAITFNEMLESLEHSYDSQRRFTADASHEIRAPLTAIRGNLELITRNPAMGEEEKIDAVHKAVSEVERLTRLVNDLLALARADAGLSLRFEPVELDAILIESQMSASHLSDEIDVSIAQIEAITVHGDSDRLKEMLIALLDNAVRYSATGGEVQISLDRDSNWAVITIHDSGIGIDESALPRIFDRFWRADAARSRDSGGTGLGLSIVKWIVDTHSGEISFETSPGVGTRVTVKLPL